MDEDEDLYAVIGVERSATAAQIKKAYFKKALLCHPDKCPDDPNATEQFQQLSRAHAVLSDQERRAFYDESGVVDDGDGGLGAGAEGWEAYFRATFPSLTLERIEAFAEEYRGSEEERGHVLEAYREHRGNMDGVVDGVMCALEGDRGRFRGILDAALRSGELQPLGDDADDAAEATDDAAATTSDGEEKKKMTTTTTTTKKGGTPPTQKQQAAAKAAAKAKKRQAKADREAAEAEELLKEIQLKQKRRLGGGSGGGSGSGSSGGEFDLAAMIQARNKERSGNFESWAEGLEARYAAMEKDKKGKKGQAKKRPKCKTAA